MRIFGYSSRALAKAEQKYQSLFVNIFQTILHMQKQTELYTDYNHLPYVLSSAKFNAIGKL